MKAVVLLGHGDLPVAMKKTTEMIAGEMTNLYALSLLPDEGKDEFSQKLNTLETQLNQYEELLIFVDLLGGSPANAAVASYAKETRVTIISGMNLPMVLTAVMGELSTQTLLTEGKNGIKDVKATLSKSTQLPQKTAVPSTEQSQPVRIKNVRIDARGIHGQVATQWLPKLGVDRVVVIDDLAVKDDMQKLALKMAKPNSVKLSVLSTKKAVDRFTDSTAYLGESLMIIIERIDTLQQLAKLGFQFPTVTMGNVPNRPGTKAYRKTVNLTTEETQILTNLIASGTHFTAQMVPNDSSVDFDALLQA